jgi:hypothetical protein
MDARDRKAAIADYKKKTAQAGVYAVRCSVTGEVWVGQAPNLGSIENSLFFALRTGGHIHRGLQAAWNAHGADAFMLEILEALDDDEPAYARPGLLRTKMAAWREKLGAASL